jgi:hypothetical protein
VFHPVDVTTTVKAIKLQNLLKTNPARDEADRIAKCKVFFGVEADGPDHPLVQIAFLIDRKYDFDFRLRVDELDAIADEEIYEDLRYSMMARYDWFEDFLPVLNWWMSVSDSLLGSTEAGDELRPEPTFFHHRQALAKLMGGVMEAFVPAMQEGQFYSEGWAEVATASQELLKRYRLYTRYVCCFAQELFPNVNLERLFKLA